MSLPSYFTGLLILVVFTIDSSALTQQLAALVALVQNQAAVPPSPNKSQKRPYVSETPLKRLQVVDTDGSDPLGYASAASKTSPQQLQEKANRVKQQVNKMVEGHLMKQGKRNSLLAPAHAPSVNDFVVRTRAQILAENKAKEQAAIQEAPKVMMSSTSEAPAVVPPTITTSAATLVPSTTTPVPAATTPVTSATTPVTSAIPTEADEASFDEGDVDDSDFRDGWFLSFFITYRVSRNR